ncbi:MAG: hypothetical protein K6357_04730 [Elusimicrobiota bacterium]
MSNIFGLSDDNFSNTYSIAYSNTLVSFPVKSNPATYGDIRNLTLSCYYSNLNYGVYDNEDYQNSGFELFLPKITYTKNMTYYFSYEKNEVDKSKINIFSFGGASYNLIDFESEKLDIGFNIKKLNLENIVVDGESSKALFDVGFLVRKKDYLFGLSFINLNSNFEDKDFITVSRGTKFSIARIGNEFSVGFDITQRKLNNDLSSYSLALSASQLWRTYRYGSFTTALSMMIGDKRSSAGFGVFYKRDIWEAGYAFSFALNSPHSFNNALSLSVFWGKRDVESDYEKVIQREVKYRKDLMAEIYEAQKREEKLKANISKMQSEIDELVFNMKKLEDLLNAEKLKKKEIEEEKNRIKQTLDNIIEKQRRQQEELKDIEEKRRLEKLKLIEMDFNRDFETYMKIKSQGAAKEVLSGYLKKIISQYQDSGIDISIATVEMQNLLK